MSPRDLMAAALRGLNANKLRSLLTILGVSIGVGAVIVLVAVGNGSGKAVQARLEAWAPTCSRSPRPAVAAASSVARPGRRPSSTA